MNPDCRDGKHRACVGDGWDGAADAPAPCSCTCHALEVAGNLVSDEDIERIVGQTRHNRVHYGRAVTAEQTFYILHSHECKDKGQNLRSCEYQIALNRGIPMYSWQGFTDEAAALYIERGNLYPLGLPRCEALA